MISAKTYRDLVIVRALVKAHPAWSAHGEVADVRSDGDA